MELEFYKTGTDIGVFVEKDCQLVHLGYFDEKAFLDFFERLRALFSGVELATGVKYDLDWEACDYGWKEAYRNPDMYSVIDPLRVRIKERT